MAILKWTPAAGAARWLIFSVAALFFSAPAQAWDSAPFELIMPGHTSSVHSWDRAASRYVLTCDYKSLSGATPRLGEPCDGSPRLAFSVEDLTDLRYVSQARDSNEMVQRIYERFPKILFVTSPNLEVDYGSSPEAQEAGTIDVHHPYVSANDAHFFAQRAKAMLTRGEGTHYVGGVIIFPYMNDANLEENDFEPARKRLPDFSIVFLARNPSRTTILHELLHHMIHRARERAIVDPTRLNEITEGYGVASLIDRSIRGNSSSAISKHGRAVVGEQELLFEFLALQGIDGAVAEELTIAHFIASYGKDLQLSEASQNRHRESFWRSVDLFKEKLSSLEAASNNGIGSLLALELHRENAPLPQSTPFFENPLTGIMPINTFRAMWAAVSAMATAYPKNLLGNEQKVQRSNPQTIIDRFVLDVGPRSSTSTAGRR